MEVKVGKVQQTKGKARDSLCYPATLETGPKVPSTAWDRWEMVESGAMLVMVAHLGWSGGQATGGRARQVRT